MSGTIKIRNRDGLDEWVLVSAIESVVRHVQTAAWESPHFATNSQIRLRSGRVIRAVEHAEAVLDRISDASKGATQ